MAYVHTGEDSLRTDVYQPLYTEIRGMDLAVHANNRETIYSSDVYQKLTLNGNLGRIPKSLRKEIIQLYAVEGEARSYVTPLSHKISILMPPEIARIRNESDDETWKEKAVAELNSEATNDLNRGSFSIASFTINHSGISPSIDVRNPAHLKFASPGTVTWLLPDWMDFPKSATDVAGSWRSTYYLGFDEKVESWNYRITQEDLTKNHTTLEEFLRPTYQVLAKDPDFQNLVRDSQSARELVDGLKLSLADRVEQPKHLADLIDFF